MIWFVVTDAKGASMAPPPVTVTPMTESPLANGENYYLEMYNRMIHGFNQWLFSWLTISNDTTDTLSAIIPEPLKTGTTNFMSNLINEPLTIVASLLEGDKSNALKSATRFIINTTVGFGGVVDAASHLGYSSDYRDLGLAMCKYGIPPGPHIVVPLVGPRTLRDGTADVVLINVLYLSLIASVFGASPNMSVLIGIIFMETIGDLALLRQIDSPDANDMNKSYEVIRDHYLSSRKLKCRDIE